MRQRSRLNPRELAREGRRRAGRMRAWSGGRPDAVTVLVEKRLEDGRYQIKRDGWPCSIYVPATPAGARIPTPRRMPLLFESGNSQRPFLLWPARSHGAFIGPGSTALPDHYAPWLRLAIRAAHRWFASDWDDPEVPDSAIVFAADERIKGTGSIVRTDSQGVLWWAEANKLRSRNLATGAETTTDLGSEITALSLCPLTERPYAWAGVYDPGEEQVEAYEQGWQAALVALEALEDTVRNQGYYDCSSETEYQAETMAIYYAYSELPAPTSPPVDEDEIGNYQSGWSDAVMSETKRLYDEGWRDSGCEVPES